MSIPQSGGGPVERPEQLVEYLASGCKPATEWRLGTEHEKFGYIRETLAPLPYDGPTSVRAMLEGLRDSFGWAEAREAGHLIGLHKGGANISLEPGGQLELSGAILNDIHQTRAELDTHLAEVKQIGDRIGAGFFGLGAAPIWTHDQMPMMPKGRYRLMTPYMRGVGTMGTSMMYRTCTVQVNLDFASEADMVRKLRVALALQPVATALFATSPFFDGQPNGHRSWRSRIWRDLDASRTGMLPWAFEDGMGFERYADFALDVPMYFVYRDGRYINALGQSFRDFLKGELPALPGEVPTLSDWADHLTTCFPEARIKKYMEMRGADAGRADHTAALSAFWVGLMYDGSALDAAWDMVKGWDAATRDGLRVAASERALAAEAGGVRMADLAARVLDLAAAGLAARGILDADGRDETRHLDVLRDRVARGASHADDLLAAYHGAWGGDLTRLYAAESY